MFSCVCLHKGRPVITNTINHFGEELSIVNGNEQVGLICTATGDDLAGGYWERLNPPQNLSNMSLFLYSTNSHRVVQLTIVSARTMHSGKYRCVVYSQWGMAHSDNVTVTITSK